MVLLSAIAVGQHGGLMSQYMFNGLVINPAYAGSKEVLTVNVDYRNQWTGFDGAPVTQHASIHSPIGRGPISIGGQASRQEIGVSTDIVLKAVVSYKIKFETGQLRFGLGAGIGSTNSRWSQVITEEFDDPLFHADVTGVMRPVFSAGAYYDNKKWYAGYSMPSIMRYEFKGSDAVESRFSAAQTEHVLTAGYAHKYNRRVVVKPSILLRAVPTSGVQVDLNTNVIFSNRLWTGLSYRHLEAVIAMVEYQVHHQLKVGYAYDFNIGPIGRYSAGSHELMVMWELRKQSFARTPRYF